jgi:hypothetical protein
MARLIAWCSANWWLISIAIYVAVNILNAATSHWSEHKGLVRWLLFVAEALSIVSSAGRTPTIKPPLDVDKHGPAVVLLAASLLLAGCCGGSSRCYLARGLTATKAADAIALPAIEKSCVVKVSTCGAIPRAGCPPYLQCVQGLAVYQASMDAIGRALGVTNRVLSDLGVK